MLKISANGRFLTHADGTPFFYLGDTAWELFHRCTLDEAERYLTDRAAKHFTVIQAVVLADLDGLHTPNMSGHVPLIEDDPTRPNEAYFAHVDAIVDMATTLGLYIAMLPCWGDKWNLLWGVGPEIFTPDNARSFGLFLGRRYSDRPIIWVLGGDRPIDTENHLAIVRTMAEGLREGDGGNHLISYHPTAPHSSSEYVHEEEWLDFNMCQSGHDRNVENWRLIEADYALTPTRPCMDAEAGYEDMPGSFDTANGYFDDYEVRKTLYWALFAGAHGHTYGCNPVWQMWRPGRDLKIGARRTWYEALSLPGSAQMQHARALLLSRPFLERIPDQSLIASPVHAGAHHESATRDAQGSYALIYVPSGNTVELDVTRLSGERLNGYWYDPRTGTALHIGQLEKGDRLSITPPQGGPDWLLVLDDAASGFSPPGSI